MHRVQYGSERRTGTRTVQQGLERHKKTCTVLRDAERCRHAYGPAWSSMVQRDRDAYGP